jgi:hypothetical protein
MNDEIQAEPPRPNRELRDQECRDMDFHRRKTGVPAWVGLILAVAFLFLAGSMLLAVVGWIVYRQSGH